jgi:hypothetical protein
MLQHSTMGQVELDLGKENLNTTQESSIGEINMISLPPTTQCTPGKRQDPSSCARYFMCVEFQTGVFREYYLYCPPYLVYDPSVNECVSLYSYQCQVPNPPILRHPPFYPPLWPTPIWPGPPPIWPGPPPLPPGR